MDKESIRRIREFNRRYTVWLNVMNRAYLGTEYNWQESRILFELYLHEGCSAAELSARLGIDKSYLSRTLSGLERRALVSRRPVPGGRGMKKLYLTAAGSEEARLIDRRGDMQMQEKLRGLDEDTLNKLCQAMEFIRNTLEENEKKQRRNAMDIQIVPAYDYKAEIGALFSEYTNMLVEGDSSFQAYLDIQNYDAELEHLEDKYGEPEGRLYIALVDEKAAGCIGLRRIDDASCEMKRLYVRPEFRGQHLGELLANKIIADARQIGYRQMLLDTLPFLESAIHMYEKLGFSVIDKYNNSPMDTSIYMKLEL